MAATTSSGELLAIAESPTATLEQGALIIARDAYPTLDVRAYLARLDTLADIVADRLDRGSTVIEEVAALRDVLYVEAAVRGNREDYYDPRNSYLNDVLDRGLGIPISLAVLIIAVARRAGIVADGVAFPGNFIVRIGGPRGIVVDPFQGMQRLGPEELQRLAVRVLGAQARVASSHLETTSKRVIFVRMLTNLRSIHEQRRDHRAALVVCDRLVELGAGPPAMRDRGLHALALGARAAAREDLARYLSAAPEAADRGEIERAIERAGSGADWN
jgi:regulator of sirC expression with transglutaminase-like and TPR domain